MNLTVNQSGTGRVFFSSLVAAGRRMTFEDCYSGVDLMLDTDDRITRVGGITNFNEMANTGETVAIQNCLYAGSINVDTTRASYYANIGGILGVLTAV
jgi:hypothetical protein